MAGKCLLLLASMFIVADPVPQDKRPDKLPSAVAPEATDITGIYNVTGDEGGKKYKNQCIIKRLGDAYYVAWLSGQGIIQGVGIRTGDTFSVGWSMTGSQGQLVRGVNVYAIKAKTMTGRWATFGNPNIRNERMAFAAPIEKDDDE